MTKDGKSPEEIRLAIIRGEYSRIPLQ